MNRIDEMTDAFMKFFDEYAQKQQVSKFGRCGESAGSEQKKAASGPSELVRNTPPLVTEQRPIQVSGGQGQAKADAPLEPVQTGRATAGIHLVPEPPAIPLVIDELTFRSYAHNRRVNPEVSPERWAAIFGKEQVEAMEKRFQEAEPPAIPEEPEWSDGMTSLEQYKDQGVK